MDGREEATEREVASSPGPTQILSRSHGEKSPRLRDKIWVGPGDEAKREEGGREGATERGKAALGRSMKTYMGLAKQQSCFLFSKCW